MIEHALVFALGALFSAIVALMLFPVFSRRAVRLARRELESKLPMTIAEFAAAKDSVRAELAARTARIEHDLKTARSALVTERLAMAEAAVQLSGLTSERSGLVDGLRHAEERIAELHADLRQREDALARLTAERREIDRALATERRRGADAEARAGEAERLAWEMRDALLVTEQAAADLMADALPSVEEVLSVPFTPEVRLEAAAPRLGPPARAPSGSQDRLANPPAGERRPGDVPAISVGGFTTERAGRSVGRTTAATPADQPVRVEPVLDREPALERTLMPPAVDGYTLDRGQGPMALPVPVIDPAEKDPIEGASLTPVTIAPADESRDPTGKATVNAAELADRVHRMRRWVRGLRDGPDDPAPEPGRDGAIALPAPGETGDGRAPNGAADRAGSGPTLDLIAIRTMPAVAVDGSAVAPAADDDGREIAGPDGAEEPSGFEAGPTAAGSAASGEPSLLDLSPDERARRIDDLARRLRSLRTRNATARARRDDDPAEAGADGSV